MVCGHVVTGYQDGTVAMWDCGTGKICRSIQGNGIAVEQVKFVNPKVYGDGKGNGSVGGQDRDTVVITVASNGVVNKLNFTGGVFGYGVEVDCLLDGTAGSVVGLSVGERCLALSSSKSSFVVVTEPSIRVVNKWPSPHYEQLADKDNNKQTTTSDKTKELPCLCWTFTKMQGQKTEMLCRGWGDKLQFLKMNLPEPEAVYPSFGSEKVYVLRGEIMGLSPLPAMNLACLISTGGDGNGGNVRREPTVIEIINTTSMTVIGVIDVLQSLPSSPPSSGITFTEYGNGKVWYNDSFAHDDNQTYVLSETALQVLKVENWNAKIERLIASGEWLHALSLCLDHYSTQILSESSNLLRPSLSRSVSHTITHHPFFSPPKPTDEEVLLEQYITQYLSLAIENAPSSPDATASHFRMIANVVIEYCVVTRRLDLLFGSIFTAFVGAGQSHTFVDLLEPFVLSDQLTYISPLVMSTFVEFCKISNDLGRVERCLVHLDVKVMDFDSVLKLLRNNKMFSALFHVYTSGLDDFVTPLQILYEEIFDTADSSEDIHRFANGRQNGGDALVYGKGGSSSRSKRDPFESAGGLGALYIERCFKDERFPRGGELSLPDGNSSVISQILNLLLAPSYIVSKNPNNRREAEKSRGFTYPYIRILLALDPQAVLSILSDLMMKEKDGGMWDLGEESGVIENTDIVAILQEVFGGDSGLPPFSRQIFLDFVADLIEKDLVSLEDAQLVQDVLVRLADDNPTKLVPVLSALTPGSYDRTAAFEAVEGHNRAELVLHRETRPQTSDSFSKVIKCFLVDGERDFRFGVFMYVEETVGGVGNGDEMRGIVMEVLPDLVSCDVGRTVGLVKELFLEHFGEVMVALKRKGVQGEILYSFLRFIFMGQGDTSEGLVEGVGGVGLTGRVGFDDRHLFIQLMCKYDGGEVYDFLKGKKGDRRLGSGVETGYLYQEEEDDDLAAEDMRGVGDVFYNIHTALQICREFDLTDATAYLLELAGDVDEALELMLRKLENDLVEIKTRLRTGGRGVKEVVGRLSKVLTACL
eukprot:CAMPEP_0118635700 /NCGR_PEP_ID=MMETSP0785-20121206/2214_1 /TAXON_ID=91992 /ORGANISM="Bolidomonas pacifica, Strain CCMP 1866" /LENGTH=1039 /DNA_ID=CAMNT_0006526747 /DNA_START=209 /DNA_END=3325 /DNA_ORIENTATION=+